MSTRRGFTLVEIVVATLLLVGVVIVASRAGAALLSGSAATGRWRRSAGEVAEVLRRFERSPCTLLVVPPAEVLVGDLTLRWWVAADSGYLEAVAWPGDAPLVIRRGMLRSVLPCR